MSKLNKTIWCDGCGEEITWSPLIKDECHYCCLDCMDGLPCPCYRWSELDLDRREEESEIDSEYYF
jgi:hypothetical protein